MIFMQRRRRVAEALRGLSTDTRASQIVEFAVALPLLLVLAVGIFDFGSAFNMKQKLTNAAREAARLGASSASEIAENCCNVWLP